MSGGAWGKSTVDHASCRQQVSLIHETERNHPQLSSHSCSQAVVCRQGPLHNYSQADLSLAVHSGQLLLGRQSTASHTNPGQWMAGDGMRTVQGGGKGMQQPPPRAHTADLGLQQTRPARASSAYPGHVIFMVKPIRLIRGYLHE